MKVAGLVLAAGGGSRLGRPKAEVKIGGRRLVDLAVGACIRAGLSPVVVVLGAAWLTPMSLADVRDGGDGVDCGDGNTAEVWLVDNTDWATGMASSLRAGLAALESDLGIDAVVVTLVDTPSVSAEHLRRIGLAHTQFAEATCGTIRLKLLKLGALVRVGVRRIKIAMASACPWQDEFELAHARLCNAIA